MARVAVVGASGLIGGALARRLLARGDEVVATSRGGAARVDGALDVQWDPADGPPPDAVTQGVDAVVNLAGAPIAGGPWTASRRRVIHDSRVVTTRLLAGRVGGDGGAPALVNASGIDYYGDRDGDAPVTEASPPGEGFLAETCAAWERAALAAAARGARVVTVRTAPVLSGEGGILPRLATITRMFIGGPVGGGRQWMPWIHIDDHLAVLVAAIDDPGISGPVNATVPEPVRQREFMAALGRVLGRPAVLPTPALPLRMVLGEMSTLLLDGQRAVPRVLVDRGFAFSRPDLEPALRDALGRPA